MLMLKQRGATILFIYLLPAWQACRCHRQHYSLCSPGPGEAKEFCQRSSQQNQGEEGEGEGKGKA